MRERTRSLSIAELDSLASLAAAPQDSAITRIDAPRARDHALAAHLGRSPRARGQGPDAYLGSVLGSYRVHALLGQGGMGHVYRAEHVRLRREVALKLLRRDYATRRDAVSRFFQEARTVSRIRHRNIVEVTDFVELEDGTTYIVMELLTGKNLGTWARAGVDLPRALAVLTQICDGLGAAHDVGVVHRDLKPDNVMIVASSERTELVKLLDFGVAKLLNRSDTDLGFQTAAGSVIGTPAYMSPEQAGGLDIDPRSDIYSLGAIMYELFCGEPVFRARSFGEYVRMHLTQMPVPPRQRPGGAALPAALETAILRCLDKDPAQRFARTGELRDALLAIGSAPTAAPTRRQARAAAAPIAAPRAENAPRADGSPGPRVHLADSPALRRAAIVGGAVMVGLGLAAALPGPGAQPGVSPARAAPPSVAPAPPVQTRIVEVRIESLPAGGVFAPDGTGELCRTPCAFYVDLGDGAPGDLRRFLVRRAGYADATVTVDFTSRKRDYRVVLERAASGPPQPR